jgi:hypothetical protein
MSFKTFQRNLMLESNGLNALERSETREFVAHAGLMELQKPSLTDSALMEENPFQKTNKISFFHLKNLPHAALDLSVTSLLMDAMELPPQ